MNWINKELTSGGTYCERRGNKKKAKRRRKQRGKRKERVRVREPDKKTIFFFF